MLRRIGRVLVRMNNQKGFTLIEMAIVLIIIGIIIGAVVKGKDVMKSAEQKRLYTTFVREWQVAYNNYYDRTGWILGDQDSTDNNTGANPRDGRCSGASETNLNSQLTRVGLTAPSPGPTGLTNVRSYTDSNGIQYIMTLSFNWDADIGNFLRLASPNGAPVDMGLALDRIVDGSADGTTGDLQYDSDSSPVATQDAWPSAGDPVIGASRIYMLLEF